MKWFTDLVASVSPTAEERAAERRYRPTTHERAFNARLQAAGAVRVREERAAAGDWMGARRADKMVKRKTARAKVWDDRSEWSKW